MLVALLLYVLPGRLLIDCVLCVGMAVEAVSLVSAERLPRDIRPELLKD
jgi:hypothetical protein